MKTFSERSKTLNTVMRAEFAFYNGYRNRFLKDQTDEEARRKMDITVNAIISFRKYCERDLMQDDYPECYDRAIPLRSDELLKLLPSAEDTEEKKPAAKKQRPAAKKQRRKAKRSESSDFGQIESWHQMDLSEFGYVI